MQFSYPRNVHFECTKCAICCGDTKAWIRHILMLESEANRISTFTSKPIKKFLVKIEGHEPYVYEMKKTAKEGKCVFLKENLCTIYSSRPLICRFYPFELRTTENGKREFLYTMECPGLGKGRRLQKIYFKNLLQQLEASRNSVIIC